MSWSGRNYPVCTSTKGKQVFLTTIGRARRRRTRLSTGVLITLVALFGLTPLPSQSVEPHRTETPVVTPDTTEEPTTEEPTTEEPTTEEPTTEESTLVSRDATVDRRRPRKRVANFTVASFNVLGHRHTKKGGNAASFANSRKRMKWTVKLIRGYGIDVIGFQELQPEQLKSFKDLTNRRWALYPAARLARIDGHNSVAWKSKVWKKLKASWVKVPYLRGERVRMPIVTLRHRATGRVVRFANFHNAADVYGSAQKLRNKARRIEVRLARKLSRKGHLVITGDMNETKRYFCAMTRQAPMHAAIFGQHRRGRCVPPRPMEIDWVFGSPRVKFPRARIAEGRMVSKTSDHALIVARAKIRRSAR